MQPHDMLTLFCHLNKTSRASITSLKKLNWTDEQITDSESRLINYGLLTSQSLALRFDRIQLFLTEAISFWWPSQSSIRSKGLSLLFPLKSLDLNFKRSDVYVWSDESSYQTVDGLVIEPLFKELPQFVLHDQDLKQFFSLIEFLRFDEHPAKSAAKAEMIDYLNGLARIHKQNFPEVGDLEVELPDQAMDKIVRFVCQNGFRSLTLNQASVITLIPKSYFISRWETDQTFRLWVLSQSHQEFYGYLAPLIGKMSVINKGHLAIIFEDYLNYIESHEAFYRLLLWAYLENDPTLQEMNRRSQLDYFETILALFKKSKPEAQKNAEFFSYLFTSIWKLYASFIWCDSKTLAPKVNLHLVRTQLRRFVMESVFETF